ncbi:hypothetical protein BD310DRAFT_925387 [Dichomitus squalens]|uniref:Secreted protein n=1 Tax=Dichomitus squalens TaxID=114155 RepID=A0A4Q9PXB7_9APHY|nr:hypothetical protein BD310DRAFT_925387 [Dichomitus squalens]
MLYIIAICRVFSPCLVVLSASIAIFGPSAQHHSCWKSNKRLISRESVFPVCMPCIIQADVKVSRHDHRNALRARRRIVPACAGTLPQRRRFPISAR